MKITKANKQKIMKSCPTEMCHASSILKNPDGTMLVAWFGGSREGNDDVQIWLSRFDGQEWGEPLCLTNEKAAHWNPVLFRISDEEIVLFYKLGEEIRSWQTMVMRSMDNGIHWALPVELVKGDFGGRGPVRNKPIRLTSGKILAPASQEDGIWSAFVDLSEDDGKSWQKQQEIFVEGIQGSQAIRTVCKEESNIPVSEQSFYGRGVIQPTLWETEAGEIHMLLRSTEGYIYQSKSMDDGRTWQSAIPTTMPNNNSGIDVVKVEGEGLFLVCNPVAANWGVRTPITLFYSGNNGVNWQELMVLDGSEGEYSYPAIITENNRVYITYTDKRKNICFWTIDFEKRGQLH